MFQIKKVIVRNKLHLVFQMCNFEGFRLSVSVVLEEQPGRGSLSSAFLSRIILSPFQGFWGFWRPNALFPFQPILLSKVIKQCNITEPGFYTLVPKTFFFFFSFFSVPTWVFSAHHGSGMSPMKLLFQHYWKGYLLGRLIVLSFSSSSLRRIHNYPWHSSLDTAACEAAAPGAPSHSILLVLPVLANATINQYVTCLHHSSQSAVKVTGFFW